MSSIVRHSRLAKSESGVVAVMVTLIMMLVISLIVLGFAQVSRRAQRNALDTQLSTQAFYAAESGINDAMMIMRNELNAGNSVPSKDTCGDQGAYQFNTIGMSTLGTGVSYTCVLVDPTPTSLVFTVDSSKNQVIKLKSQAGTTFNNITFSWAPQPQLASQLVANCPAAAGQYPVATGTGQWNCKFAVLRTELAPTPTTAAMTRASLINNTHVNFLGPLRPGSTSALLSNWLVNNARAAGTVCSETACQLSINVSPAASDLFYLRLSSLYGSGPTKVTITAKDTNTTVNPQGDDIHFAEAQALVSVTGKAQDVLRRILEAVSLDGDSASAPSSAIVSGDSICKRFSVTNGSFSGPEYDLPGDGTPANPLCEANTIGTPTNP